MKNSLEKLDNELHNELKNVPNKNMHVLSSFSQLTIRCPLLRGKFCPKSSQGPQKVSAIKRFFYESLTMIRPVPLKSVRLYQVSLYSMSAIDMFECIS